MLVTRRYQERGMGGTSKNTEDFIFVIFRREVGTYFWVLYTHRAGVDLHCPEEHLSCTQ